MYELIDFGEGRRLERFGMYLIDRPAAGTQGVSRDPQSRDHWSQATARFEPSARASPQRGTWLPADGLPESWSVEFCGIRFELKPTEFGHLGVFPEQAENWRFIGEWVRDFRSAGPARRPKLLNLFAYTGGSTIAAAAAGAEVVHVDSARGAVAWARRNAESNGLSAAPIRWIIEDARRFVERELARGNRYDAVILDPPSYGHGPKRQAWKIDRDLPGLLRGAIALLAGTPSLVLLSCHTPGIADAVAAQMIDESVKSIGRSGRIASGELTLRATSGPKVLQCGVAARFCG
ncbi:MAG TPA: class I SAM-dependent methyltransferase [Pirellulales bacterium]|jgi:23S rRNA (cytosine1962-C5)-methyltransferase|nr:class I SAM-dependent methyltransferase [Pirellulales bacterium]